jgi:hypothetical protein
MLLFKDGKFIGSRGGTSCALSPHVFYLEIISFLDMPERSTEG